MTDAPAVVAPAVAARPRSRLWCWRAALAAPLIGVPAWVAVASAVPFLARLATPSVAVLVLVLGVACVTDVRSRRIYNWATYTAVLWALGLQAVAFLAESLPTFCGWITRTPFYEPFDPMRLLFGLGFGFGLMFMLYVTAGGGGGDLKLVVAAGCVLGPNPLVEALITTYIAAGVLALGILVWKVGPVDLVRIGLRRLAGPLAHWLWFLGPEREIGPVWKIGIPMAPFYTFGIVATLLFPVKGSAWGVAQ